ncbi:hypothetical protein SAMN04488498_102117 [Mesorhizobium albiziae]|uniref:Uncharacterized protein n=1 Tax=Neomesorhizobium albiziae TaxID=335020 RepID=A0A1I3WF92_9HYPH|nr:hypothetical protein [Mesorhizobium albiziae]GLS31520.1 hypothetical protein GCM10007937_32300 [Mesorhizobium albiziae]SFK05106.1 hypothetical protein SAMN04488498_102117 [Mesorhizobium albiziae]
MRGELAPEGLVADCGGAIEEIAIAVVPGCFGGDPLLGALLAALGKFARTLPEDVALHVLGTAATRGNIERWLDGLGLACRTVFVEAGLSAAADTADFWMQDPLLVVHGEGGARYLQQDCENPGDHAAWLSRATSVPVERAAMHLAGGNLLVGPDFRLTGQDSIDLTQAIIDREKSTELAFERLSAIDRRPLHVAGYGYGAPTREPPRAGAWNDPYRMRQYGGHIDRFVALTGQKSADGRPLILVADAMLGPGGRAEEFGSTRKRLGQTAERLEFLGFAVQRNPVPFVPAIRDRQLRARLYNNIVLENEIRKGRSRPLVWLPHYADAEPALADFDAENAALWRGLGFEPVPAHGWTKLTVAMGAVRCATKVLRRSPSFRFAA